MKEAGEYRVLAAGPTTSIREEPFQADTSSDSASRL